jgi:LysR family transcriptional regulator, low CO2-responsive transcriptional regulator
MLTDALDIKRLRAFQLVARHGSLRIAATRLHQTVSAVSLKIRRLEDDIGVELFDRLPNKMILTDAGKRFLREVDGLFDHAEHILKELTSPRAVGSLAISIGSDHSSFFAPRISRFVKKNPGVELSLQVYPTSEAIAGLKRGELDVALGIFPDVPRGLKKHPVIETTLALLCPVGHPLTRRRTPVLRDLATYRLILPPSNAVTRKMIDRTFAAASVQPDNIIEVANCGTAKTFVEEGVGLAIAHSLCVGRAPSPKLQWIDLDRHFSRIEFCVVYRQGNNPQSVLLQRLLNEMEHFE